MAPFRYLGPICQVKDWYASLDDGTLARVQSPLPGPVGLPTVAGQSPAPTLVNASGDCSFLNPRNSGTVIAPTAAFDRLRKNSGAAKLSSTRQIASQTWLAGSSSPAVEQEIQIGDRTIKVIRPTDADASGKNLPTTVQVADALRAIPAHQRTQTTTVILSPSPHPDTTSKETIAGTAGSGEITLFPISRPQSQNDFDNRFMHESGHNYQASLWKSGQDVKNWQIVATADNRLPSPYAGSNAGDDFCEFNILYNTTQGTPCEATAVQLYPNRWRKRQAY